jgi:uncharacterized protein YciI
MALFVWIGHDGPRGVELRKLHREEHLRNLELLEADGRIRHAGPLLDPEGRPTGSVILFEAEDLEAARAIASSDPYVVQGIFDRYEVFETRRVFPKG